MNTNSALGTILRWQLLALALISMLMSAQPAEAVVLVVKSDDLPQYSGPISAFETALEGSTRLIEIGGSRDKGEKLLKDAAANEKVEAVFALGSQAAYLSRRMLPKTPLVFAMVLDWTRYELGSGATGVAVEMPVDALFTRFKLLLPQIERIGVIHSDRTSKTATAPGHRCGCSRRHQTDHRRGPLQRRCSRSVPAHPPRHRCSVDAARSGGD